MTSPGIVVLDTRQATDKASFLGACAQDLQFPDYFGRNWDAFEECLRDFADERRPAVVVWTGAAQLPQDVRRTALQVFESAFTDGVDLLVVDDVSAGVPPIMTWAERLIVPVGGLPAATRFWASLGVELVDGVYDGPGLTLQIAEVEDFHPMVGPILAVADIAELRQRADAAGLPLEEDGDLVSLTDPFGTLISFTPY